MAYLINSHLGVATHSFPTKHTTSDREADQPRTPKTTIATAKKTTYGKVRRDMEAAASTKNVP